MVLGADLGNVAEALATAAAVVALAAVAFAGSARRDR